MAQLGKRAAGHQVTQLAMGLSDQLLDSESEAFAGIDQILVAAANQAAAALDRSERRHRNHPDRAAKDATLRAELKQLQRDCVVEVVATVTVLAGVTRRDTLASMQRELETMEKTLAGRFRGLGQEAVDIGEDETGGLVDQAVSEYHAIASQLAQDWTPVPAMKGAQTMQQIRTQLLGLANPVGHWWALLPTYKQNARSLSVSVMNRVREACMAGFNTAHTRRDG